MSSEDRIEAWSLRSKLYFVGDASVYSIEENATAEIAFTEGSGRVMSLYKDATGLYFKASVTCNEPCTTRTSWLDVIYKAGGSTATDMRGAI